MQYYYNSRDLACKKPFGAVDDAQETELNFFAQNGVFVNDVYLVLTKDGETPVRYAMDFLTTKDEKSVFRLKIGPLEAGLYWYRFEVRTELGQVGLYKGEAGGASESSKEEFQLTVFSRNFKTPEFFDGGLIYHIFVDRFNRGRDADAVFEKNGVLKAWNDDVTVIDPDGVFRANDFFGGNLQGIIDKLDYLKSLGVTLIYLSPIFKSASNHRYDTGNYLKIDELLGTEAKFAELIKAAKARGMEIMLDGVFNHTGADSLYFNKFGNYPSLGAYQSRQSPYFDWFTFSRFPDKYNCWWGITVTPTVNKPCAGFENLIFGEGGVIDKYMKLGVKAWRLDVVDELNPEFVRDLRSAIKSRDKDALIIGEVWEDASNKISYGVRRGYFQGGQLDGVMNYPFKDAILSYISNGDKNAFVEKVSAILENYPKPALAAAMNVVGTHDTWRILNVCAAPDVRHLDKTDRKNIRIDRKTAERCLKRLKIAVGLQFTLVGVPSIYYGDERGLDGFEDPLNRRTIDWDDYNPDIFAFYEIITSVRTRCKGFFKGDMCFVAHPDLLIFRRYYEHAYISVVANNTCKKAPLKLERESVDLLTGEVYRMGENFVNPESILILAKNI